MEMQFLSTEATMRVLELASKPYRPKAIVDLKELIAGEIRAAELAHSITGVIDNERIQTIVAMKLELDGLCCAWAEGRLE